jgi:gamma-glutamylaminecyclotransferase
MRLPAWQWNCSDKERNLVSQELLYLFVYGTLKRGECNHGLLAGQQFIQEAVTEPAYRLLDTGPHPALIEVPTGGRTIHGEIYRIDRPTLARLDVLEEAPRVYRLATVRLQDFLEPVVTYLYQQDVSTFPDCGTSWPR